MSTNPRPPMVDCADKRSVAVPNQPVPTLPSFALLCWLRDNRNHMCAHAFAVARYSQVLSGARRSTPAGIVDFVPVGYDLELVEVRCSCLQGRSERRAS